MKFCKIDLKKYSPVRNACWRVVMSVSLWIFLCSVSYGQSITEQKKIDSIKQLIRREKVDTIKADLYDRLARSYNTISLDSAYIYSSKGYELSKKISFVEGQLINLSFLMNIHYQQNNLAEALKNTKEGLEIAKKYTIEKQILNFTNKLGGIYYEFGNYEMAISAYQQALKIAEKIDSLFWITGLINNLGALYAETDNHKMAISYYSQGLERLKSTKEYDDLKGSIYVNISESHRNLKQYTKAIKFLNKGLEIFKKSNNKNYLISAYNNLGYVYFELKKYDQAEAYINQSMTLAKKINNYTNLNSNYHTLGSIYVEKGMYAKAMELYQKGLDTAIKQDKKHQIIALKESIVVLLAKQNDYENAYKNLDKLVAIKDSITGIEKLKSIEKLQIAFEVEKKDAQISLLEKDKQIKEIEKRNFQKFQMVFIICGILLIILLIALYNRFKKTKGLLNTIKKKNTENELLVQEIHHRVKNNLQIVLSLLGSYADKKDIDKNTVQILTETQNKIKSMALIHQNLYNDKSFGAISSITYFESLIVNIKKTYINSVSKSIKVNTNIIDTQLQMKLAVPLGLIVNELLTNIYKYAFTNDVTDNEVYIAFINKEEKKKHTFGLQIKDNGIGMPKSFNINNIESFGIQIVRGLVEQLDGSIVMKNENGVLYDISIPSG